MTINELKDVSVDPGVQEVRVYDLDGDGRTIYQGSLEDVPDGISDIDVTSIDIVGKSGDDFMGINVSLG